MSASINRLNSSVNSEFNLDVSDDEGWYLYDLIINFFVL